MRETVLGIHPHIVALLREIERTDPPCPVQTITEDAVILEVTVSRQEWMALPLGETPEAQRDYMLVYLAAKGLRPLANGPEARIASWEDEDGIFHYRQRLARSVLETHDG